MASNTINQFQQDLNIAAETMAALNLKGVRPQAVVAFVTATSDEERLTVVESHGAGLIRRGLRQVARRMERKGNQDVADTFWALRDDIDEEDETVFQIEAADVA